MMKKTIVVSAIIAALVFIYYWFVLRTVPSFNEQIEIPRIEKSALVKIDTNAVPYIEAESPSDMYAVQGYLSARERMFQMDILRRTAKGELSEIFGRSTLDSDRFMRSIGIRRDTDEEFSQLNENVRSGLEAYCRGVNAYISNYFNNLPLEFTLLAYKPKPWHPTDTLAVMKYLDYQQDESWRLDDLRQRVQDKIGVDLANELFKDDWSNVLSNRKTVGDKDDSLHEISNNHLFKKLINKLISLHPINKTIPSWGSTAVSVKTTNDNASKSYLLCDKHTDFVIPSYWYLCGLHTTGLNVTGASVPGIPGIVLGRNKFIAWAGASLRADVQDLYFEQFESAVSKKYKSKGNWLEAQEIIEFIPVRFSKDVVQKVLITKHGPVIVKNSEWAIALSWTGNKGCIKNLTNVKDVEPALNVLWKLNRASDWDTFSKSLKGFSGSPQIFTYSDYLGNIGYQTAGIVPKRNSNNGAADGTKIMSGPSGDGDWINKFSFEQLPSSNKIDFVIAANQKILPNNNANFYGQYFLGHQWSAPYRANRLYELIGDAKRKNESLSLSFLNKCQSDCYVSLVPIVANSLNDALVNNHSNDRFKITMAHLLKNYNGELKTTSSAATVYEAYVYKLCSRLVEPKLGIELTREYLDRWPLAITFVEHFLTDKPMHWLPPYERTFTTFLLATLSQSLTDIKISISPFSDNSSKWLWKNVHIAFFEHPISRIIPWTAFIFNVGPISVSGDSNTVNTQGVSYTEWPGKFASNSGTTLRMLVDMSDKNMFYLSTVPGQSGVLGSPFRLDQLKAWQNADLKPIACSFDQINKQAKYKITVRNAEGK
jgi:penicillin amidase